jgi:ribonuclease HI
MKPNNSYPQLSRPKSFSEGYGVINQFPAYKNKNEIWGKSLFIGDKNTNNEAEYMGLIIGLEEAINIGVKNLYVEGDSLLVIKQMKGLYKVKAENLYKLYEKAKKLEKQFTSVSYNHVYRDKNKRADELSNMALNHHV